MKSLSNKYWYKNCDAYIRLFGDTDNYPSHLTQIVVPALTKIIKKHTKTRDRVLDIGCGEGYLTRLVDSLNREALGCDLSPEMITASKKQNSLIRYWVQDIEKQNSNIKTPKVRMAFSNLVFTYLENIDQSLKNISCYLKSKGLLVIIIPHPCYYHEENYRWFLKENRRRFKIGRYFEEKTFVKEITNEIMTHYIHRTLSSYINIFLRNQFQLIDFLEPRPIKTSNIALEKADDVPSMAIFVLQRNR